MNEGADLYYSHPAELGSVFYSVKEKNFDDQRGARRKADREFSKKAELEMEMARQREECVTAEPFALNVCTRAH